MRRCSVVATRMSSSTSPTEKMSLCAEAIAVHRIVTRYSSRARPSRCPRSAPLQTRGHVLPVISTARILILPHAGCSAGGKIAACGAHGVSFSLLLERRDGRTDSFFNVHVGATIFLRRGVPKTRRVGWDRIPCLTTDHVFRETCGDDCNRFHPRGCYPRKRWNLPQAGPKCPKDFSVRASLFQNKAQRVEHVPAILTVELRMCIHYFKHGACMRFPGAMCYEFRRVILDAAIMHIMLMTPSWGRTAFYLLKISNRKYTRYQRKTTRSRYTTVGYLWSPVLNRFLCLSGEQSGRHWSHRGNDVSDLRGDLAALLRQGFL